MSKAAHAAEFFVVGGPVQADRPCYIERPADEELQQGIRDQHFCYVLGPRAIGKTSLMARTIRALRREGQLAAVVDLTQIGARSENTDAGRWYYSIAYRILRELRLKVDLQSWWQEKSALMSEQRLAEFFWDLVLTNTAVPVTVFFDEIERALELPFADQLFAAIRTCYARRATEPDHARLNFVVLGVAAPAQLCPDVSLSPFAEGVEIDLADFTLEQTCALASGIHADTGHARALLERVYSWAHGQPYLTQKIARGAVKKGGRLEDVDRAVHEQLLASRVAQDEPLLNHMRTLLAAGGPHRRQALLLLGRIAQGVPVYDEPDSGARTLLRLAGIVSVAADGRLDYRNRICREVFASRWVRSVRPFEWRRAGAVAAAVLALIALSLWYTQYVPEPHVSALAAADDLDTAREAHRKLRRLPGFARIADDLLAEHLSARAQAAGTSAEVLSLAAVLRTLPERGSPADRLMAEFWLGRAREEMRGERRDSALLYALEALAGSEFEAQALAAELIDRDYRQLLGTFHVSTLTGHWEVDWQRHALTTIDHTHRVERISLDERPRPAGSATAGRGRLTALQQLPLRRELSVDEQGPAGAFELLLTVRHPSAEELLLMLEAPGGAQATLPLPAQDGDPISYSLRSSDGPELAALAEQDRQGVWRLTLVDRKTGQVGTLLSWGLRFGDDGDAFWDEPEQGIAIPDPDRTDQVELVVDASGRFAAVQPSRPGTLGALALWDMESGELAGDLLSDRQSRSTPERVLFNADASRLLAVSDNALTLWDVGSQAPVARLTSETGFALPPAPSADGAYVAVAERTDTATPLFSLLRADSGAAVASVTGLPDVTQWALGPQARYLALLGPPRTVRIMNPRRGDVLLELRHELDVERILPVPGEDMLVTIDANGDIRAWRITAQPRDAAEGRRVGRTADPDSVVVAGDAPVIAFEAPQGYVAVQDLDRNRIDRRFRVERSGEPLAIRLSPDGRRVLTGRGAPLRLWRIDERPAVAAAADDAPSALAIDEQGRLTAIGFRGGHVRVRSATELERAPGAPASVDYIGHRGAVSSLALGPGHSLIASGGHDGVVRVWDLASVAPAPFFMRHPAGPVHAVAVSGNGRWLASAAEHSARIWRAQDGALSGEIPVNGTALAVAFAPDSASFVIGDSAGNVLLGEPDSSLPLRSARAQGAVAALAFTPDGQWVASGDGAGSVQLWDGLTLEPIGQAYALPHPVRWLRFTGDGLHLLVQTDHWMHRIEASGAGLRALDSRLLAIGLEAGAAPLTLNGERLRLVGGRWSGRPVVQELDMRRPPPVGLPTDAELWDRDWPDLLGLTIGPMGSVFTVP